jgi:adenylate cyclase
MEPAALTRFVTDFRRVVTRAVHDHHGVVDKFIGDNAMVVFGVPEPGPGDARNAVRCARAILSPDYSVRPEGAQHQWRKVPPRELSVELVADERLGRATVWVEAS